MEEPILITREKLIQYGFNMMDHDYFFRNVDADTKCWCFIDEVGFQFALDHETYEPLRYVHELEKWYFDQTETEL